jgi:hypothetical protein
MIYAEKKGVGGVSVGVGETRVVADPADPIESKTPAVKTTDAIIEEIR